MVLESGVHPVTVLQYQQKLVHEAEGRGVQTAMIIILAPGLVVSLQLPALNSRQLMSMKSNFAEVTVHKQSTILLKMPILAQRLK